MIGAKGPNPSAEVLRAAFSSEKGRERRHEREVPEFKVEKQDVFETRLLKTS
jgi:hypothetical protein